MLCIVEWDGNEIDVFFSYLFDLGSSHLSQLVKGVAKWDTNKVAVRGKFR